MTRDVTKEEQEAIKQIAYNEGCQDGRAEIARDYDNGSAVIRTGIHTYLLFEYAEKQRGETYRKALEEGRKQGIAMERTRIRKVEWRKLFGVVVAGSVIGCGTILAVAVGLSHL